MAEGGHVIGKSVFVIDVPAKSQADRCFAAISRAFQDMLPEHLPSLFDELQTGDIHLRIDRLVIDLGTLTEAELSNNLTEILLVALKEQLKKYLSSGAVYPYLTERANIEYFLRYYFSKGRYPWWANELMAARSPAEWLYEYVKGNEAEGEALIKAILRDPVSHWIYGIHPRLQIMLFHISTKMSGCGISLSWAVSRQGWYRYLFMTLLPCYSRLPVRSLKIHFPECGKLPSDDPGLCRG
jgi:hypothetical protein